MSDATQSIQAHYGSEKLVETILGALREAGHDTDNPTVEMFSLVDQLHGGGLNATKAQAELAGVSQGMKVLDSGCGIAGASRYLAHSFGCQVEAMDLTDEYVETANRLNELCGMADKVSVRQGSVTDLPFDDSQFDLVWCQNVTMNVEDKPRMFAEAFRVLVPGGRYTISHTAQGPNGEPYYPLSWADEPSYSYLGTPEEVLGWLADAGFVIREDYREDRSAGKPRTLPPGSLGSFVVMGPDMPKRQANTTRSAQEGRLVNMLLVAERPA